MFSADKTFSAFDSPQKPLRFVRVNRVLNVFAVRKQFKIIQTIICAVQILMVNLHTFGNGAVKRLPHRAMNSYLSVLSVFAWAKPDIAVPCYMRLNRTRGAVARPRLTVLDVERGRDAGAEEIRYYTQFRAGSKHGFSLVDLTGAKSFPPRNPANIRKIANFVKAFVAANGFPNLHAVDIKPVYVGGQA